MMEQVYKTITGDLSGQMFLHTTMSDEQRQGLIDDHFLFRGKVRARLRGATVPHDLSCGQHLALLDRRRRHFLSEPPATVSATTYLRIIPYAPANGKAS